MKFSTIHKTLSALMLISMTTLTSCIQDFINLGDTLSEDVTFEIATDLLYNIAAIQFFDESNGGAPANIQVEVLKSDFAEVYTYSGKMDLAPTDGTLLLGIRKAETPEAGDKKSLVLKITAPGFYPRTQNFIIDTSLSSVIVPMQSLAGSGDVSTRNTFFATSSAGSKVFSIGGRAKVTFEQNTKFLDANGNALTGSVAANFVFYEDSDETRRMFQEQIDGADFIDNMGMKSQLMVNPAAILDVDLSVGGTPIVDLTYPSSIEMMLAPDLFNPLEDRNIRSGDNIPAFYWDPAQEAWVPDGFAIAEVNNGRLQANLSVRHFTRWMIGFANVSMLAGMAEECHVFIRMLGDTPDTIRGSYMSGNQTIQYEYTQRPEYRFYQIYPGCMSGQGFDLSSLIRTVRNRANAYFRAVDANVFGSLTFDPNVNVSVQESPEMCAFADNQSLTVDILARNAGSAILIYEYGFTTGAQEVNLAAGDNSFTLPIPAGSLNPWFFSEGNFGLFYLDDCDFKSVTRAIDICDVPFGVKLGLDNPSSGPGTAVDISISAACESGETEFTIRPTAPIFFRESCDDNTPYSVLGIIQDGVFIGTLPISVGQTYDFKIQYGDVVQEYMDITIPDGAGVFGEGQFAVTIEKNAEGVIVFDFGDFVLPEGICNLIG